MQRFVVALAGIMILFSGCAGRDTGIVPESALQPSPAPPPVKEPTFSKTVGSGQPLLLSPAPFTAAPARPEGAVPQVSSAPTPAPSSASAPTPQPAPSPKVKAKPTSEPAARKPSKQASSSKTEGVKRKSWAELARQYGGSYVLRGGPQSHRVALTFDDAPDKRFTEPILSILRENDVKATFFIVGSMAEQHPELVKRIKREGHVIGNHTSRHKYLPKLSLSEFEQDVEGNERKLELLVGYKPKLLRPPYGEISEPQLQWAADHHYMTVNWDVDSRDWSGLDESAILRNILPHVHNGSIILQHAGTGPKGNLSGTVKALPLLIHELRHEGYELVTLPELLGIPKQL